MAYTLNGLSLQRCVIIAPSQGVWIAHANALGAITQDESVTITLGESQWQGVAVGVTVDGEVSRCYIVGGKGGLIDKVSSLQLVGTQSSSVIAQTIVAEVGETLDPLNLPLAPVIDWYHGNVSAGKALDALAKRLNTYWRIRPNGTVAFAAVGRSPEGGTLVRAEVDGAQEYHVQSALAEPNAGELVEHELRDDGTLRTFIRKAPTITHSDNRVIRHGTIVSQAGLECIVLLDDGSTIKAEQWHGIASVTALLTPGTPVIVLNITDEKHIAIAHPDSTIRPIALHINGTLISLDALTALTANAKGPLNLTSLAAALLSAVGAVAITAGATVAITAGGIMSLITSGFKGRRVVRYGDNVTVGAEMGAITANDPVVDQAQILA